MLTSADLITIGDEILIGQIIDSNSAWMAKKLNALGIAVRQITSVSDTPEHITEALEQSSLKSEIIIVTGGLGPTKDDKTKDTLCDFFHSKLEMNEEILAYITGFLEEKGVIINDKNRNQALVPDKCTPLFNNHGTAPGLYFKKENNHFFFLPGVPFEMKGIFEDHIQEILQKNFTRQKMLHRTILTTGIAESNLADNLEDWEDALPGHIKLAYLPKPGMVRLRLSGIGENETLLQDELKLLGDKLYTIIPELIFGEEETNLEEVIGHLLKSENETVVTAESCSGGGIASRIVSIPGSSIYFKGGVVAYENSIKTQVLNVNSKDIQMHGAVSEIVVKQMVAGALSTFKADYAIATSGIAGPDGGTIEKPVGTIWIAVGNSTKIIAQKFRFGDNRERNIERTIIYALNMLRKFILNHQKKKGTQL